MIMELQDDRTSEEHQTHAILWGGTDAFLSGWGKASSGASFAFWACEPEHAEAVRVWVCQRGDIKRVRQVSSDYRSSGHGHCHIYVVREGHSALERTV